MALLFDIMSEQSIYDYVMTCLAARRFTHKQIAAGSGVPFSTVSKVSQGATKDPGVHTIQAMADYFRREMANKADAQDDIDEFQEAA
jgi:transcriptional regulator with XRE-family HTH domain